MGAGTDDLLARLRGLPPGETITYTDDVGQTFMLVDAGDRALGVPVGMVSIPGDGDGFGALSGLETAVNNALGPLAEQDARLARTKRVLLGALAIAKSEYFREHVLAGIAFDRLDNLEKLDNALQSIQRTMPFFSAPNEQRKTTSSLLSATS